MNLRLWLSFCLLAMLASVAIAQDTVDQVIDAELQEQIDIIEANTEAMRGLDAKEDIMIYFPTRTELRAYLEGVFVEEYTPEV